MRTAEPSRLRQYLNFFQMDNEKGEALSVSTHSVRKGGRESFALCDEGGAVAVFEPANQ